MQRRFILEISVESAEAAAAAVRGGADRIELCAESAVGGVTPSETLMERTRATVEVPVFAMVRPRGGNFVYATREFREMLESIETARRLRMDGVVLGLLREDGEVDVQRSRELVQQSAPLPVTFHRAFDECRDLRRSLEDVIQTGAAKLLTSGGKPTAPEALEMLSELQSIASGRIAILPGSGIHAGNIGDVVRKTGAGEFHAALSSVVKRPAENLQAFEREVRKLAEALAGSSET